MVFPNPPKPPKPADVVVAVPNPPNNDCVVVGALPKRFDVPNPKFGVVLPNKLGAAVVVVPKEPNSGADVVVVVPNNPGAEVAGVPNKLVACVDPNKLLVVVVGVENKVGVLVVPPNKLGFVVVEPEENPRFKYTHDTLLKNGHCGIKQFLMRRAVATERHLH